MMAGGSSSGGVDLASRLKAELGRLKAVDPFKALGLPQNADGEAVRRAFLNLTKIRHPNRFARESAEIRDVANELFLVIRRAYDVLSSEEGRKQWRERLGAGSVDRTPTPQPAPQPKTPAPAPAPAPPVSPPPVARPQTVPPARRMPTTPPVTGRPPEEVQAMLESVRTRGQRLDDALALLARGKYREAREALFQIAAEDPQSKRTRVQLHLAWGLEHLSESRPAEAQRELERAVALDPECQEAQQALRKAQEQQKKGGLFGKLFGR